MRTRRPRRARSRRLSSGPIVAHRFVRPPGRPVYSVRVPVHIVDRPLVHDALVTLRDKHTPPEHFRRAATRISVLLAAEALRDVPTTTVAVETPLGPAAGRRV